MLEIEISMQIFVDPRPNGSDVNTFYWDWRKKFDNEEKYCQEHLTEVTISGT